jgi:hypothetical protein
MVVVVDTKKEKIKRKIKIYLTDSKIIFVILPGFYISLIYYEPMFYFDFLSLIKNLLEIVEIEPAGLSGWIDSYENFNNRSKWNISQEYAYKVKRDMIIRSLQEWRIAALFVTAMAMLSVAIERASTREYKTLERYLKKIDNLRN